VEQLPALSAYTLSQEPRCGLRAQRLLDGSRGAKMASTRFRLGQRVQEDAALAHSERRAPHPRDFPTPSDLTTEERAVYRAAASGYLVLFGDAPALTLDVPRRVELDALDIELAGRPGLFVDTDDGTELRMLRMSGTAPHITESQRHAVALLAGADLSPIRAIVADLLSLESATLTITSDDVEPAYKWASERLAVWRDAAGGAPVNHGGCLYCEFVWDCRMHRSTA
jgi:hypothetical protein